MQEELFGGATVSKDLLLEFFLTFSRFESLVILGADGIFRILSGDSRLQGMLIETNKRAE